MAHHRLVRRGRTWFAWGFHSDGSRWRESTRQTDVVAAKRVQREIERRRAAAGPKAEGPAPLTLRDALNDLEAFDRRAQKSPHTLEQRDNHARHLTRILGATFNARNATRADLERYADARLAEGVTAHTVAKELATLRKGMRIADVWSARLMPDIGGSRVYKPRSRWLTPAEFESLRAELSDDRAAYLDAYVGIGGRESEMRRITDADVDWAGRRARLRESKRGQRVRWVPLSALAARGLKAAPGAGTGGPLFPEWHSQNRDLRAACERAKIARVSANDLRRTFVSWLANAGVDALTTARLSGTSLAMIERTYAQLGIDTLATAIARFPGGAYQGDPEQT